jgi:hypothetical protein
MAKNYHRLMKHILTNQFSVEVQMKKQRPPLFIPLRPLEHGGTEGLGSQIELNRPMKGVSFRRVNHAELKFPPTAKLCALVRRIFPPKAGILVRCRSLGAKGFVRVFLEIRALQGKTPAFHLVLLGLFWT